MTGRAPWRAIDGVLLLDKPSGITSTAALARARRALRAAKGGHTGTLDPMASGLLPLCFGEATKFASDLLEADKSYRAVIRLGVTTATGDSEGEVLDTRAVAVDEREFEAALARYRGPIAQVPPMHSALKRDGRPLYHYARQGLVVERQAREVTIHRLVATGFDSPLLSIEVDCSKGTYVRTLAEGIGDALGCGGHLVELRRLASGTLSIGDAVPLARMEAASDEERLAMLRPLDLLIERLPRIDLDRPRSDRFAEGQRLPWDEATAVGRVRVYRDDGSLLGTGHAGPDGVLAPVRLVANGRVDRASPIDDERRRSHGG